MAAQSRSRSVRGQAHKAELGNRAEALAAAHLVEHGYAIIDRNVRVGRLEIDVIARRGQLVVFCEVRARTDDTWVAPHHTVDARKAGRIRAAAARWLREHASGRHASIRLDVASVVIDASGSPRLSYFEGAL